MQLESAPALRYRDASFEQNGSQLIALFGSMEFLVTKTFIVADS
jgi:hypothetical protein